MIWPGNKILVISRYGFVKNFGPKSQYVQIKRENVEEDSELHKLQDANALRVVHLLV